jgi:hypothetical protein
MTPQWTPAQRTIRRVLIVTATGVGAILGWFAGGIVLLSGVLRMLSPRSPPLKGDSDYVGTFPIGWFNALWVVSVFVGGAVGCWLMIRRTDAKGERSP